MLAGLRSSCRENSPTSSPNARAGIPRLRHALVWASLHITMLEYKRARVIRS